MDYYVYLHKKKTTGEVFYVGKGSGNRAWRLEGRNKFWHKIVNKHDYDIEIHSDNLQEWYAFELEKDLIAYYGRRQLGKGTLVNLSDGGEGVGGWIPSEKFKESRRTLMQREDAPNKDKRLWTFMHLETKEEIVTTRHRFRQAYPYVLVNKICTSSVSSYKWVVMENQTQFSVESKINGCKGFYSPSSDKKVYSITNVESGEEFVGMRHEVSAKIGTNAGNLVTGKCHIVMGWALTERLLSGDIKLNWKGVNASNIDETEYSFTNIETGEVFVGKRVEFESVHGINVKSLFKGNKTCKNWALSRVVSQVGKDTLKNPNAGDRNANADSSTYRFKNLLTKEVFEGTRAEFKKSFDIDINALFSGRNYKSASYWCLEENYEDAKQVSPYDLTSYTFIHSSGISFTGTRIAMKEETGVCTKKLFGSKCSLTVKGWALEHNSKVAFKRGRYKLDYMFSHDSGEMFCGTRREFEIAYSICCSMLFCKNAKEKHKGWTIISQ